MVTDAELKWLPMNLASREEFRYIAALPKSGGEPIVVYWSPDSNGWWLPEGALYQDDYFVGWTPLPTK